MGRRSTPASGIRLARGDTRLARTGPISAIFTSNVSVANGLATITVQKSGRNWTGGILEHGTRPNGSSMGLWKCVPSSEKGQGFVASHLAVPRR